VCVCVCVRERVCVYDTYAMLHSFRNLLPRLSSATTRAADSTHLQWLSMQLRVTVMNIFCVIKSHKHTICLCLGPLSVLWRVRVPSRVRVAYVSLSHHRMSQGCDPICMFSQSWSTASDHMVTFLSHPAATTGRWMKRS